MIRVLANCGGAQRWLLDMKRDRRRINQRALFEVWMVAGEVDAICRALRQLAASTAAREDIAEDMKHRREHALLLLMAAASDRLEERARHLAARQHLHTFGDIRASKFIRMGPQPADIAPVWLTRQARRAARARGRGVVGSELTRVAEPRFPCLPGHQAGRPQHFLSEPPAPVAGLVTAQRLGPQWGHPSLHDSARGCW